MSIQKRTRGYEVLIRINADGTIGAHYATISEVIEDGIVIVASPPELTSLGSVEGDNADLLQKILGEFSVTIVSANEHLAESVAKLTEECDRLLAESQAAKEVEAETVSAESRDS